MVEHSEGTGVEEARSEGRRERPAGALPKRYRVSRLGPARNLRLPSARERRNAKPYHRLSDEELEASLERDRATFAKGEAAIEVWRAEIGRRISSKETAVAERRAALAARQGEREGIEAAIDRALSGIPEEKQREIKEALARAAQGRAGRSGRGDQGG